MDYSQEALEEMAEQIDLREYASRTVDFVKQSGDTEFAVCCFHDEKTASLAVTPTIFHCFGCGKYGNIYTWLQLTEDLSFDQAVSKVSELTGTEIRPYIESDTIKFFKLLKKIHQPSKKIKVERTILDPDRDYRQKYSDEIPQEWVDEGISPDEIKKYEIMIDQSSNRITYPVYSNDDKLIGVKGRTRFRDYKDLGIMKYMNYYSLGGRLDYFQGMQQARPYIQEKNEIIVFEGLKSVMKVDQWGYHNAVSSETSTLNDLQIELLIKMQVKNVIIAFDKDVKFKKIRDNVEFLKRFANVYVVYDKWGLLDEKDSPPDKGREVWETLYERRVRA